jgi:hypothetical protein
VSGNLCLEDEQRPGRPRIWDSEATKEGAEQQPSTSTRRLLDTWPFKEYYSSPLNSSRKNLEDKPSNKSNFVIKYFSCRKTIVLLKES